MSWVHLKGSSTYTYQIPLSISLNSQTHTKYTHPYSFLGRARGCDFDLLELMNYYIISICNIYKIHLYVLLAPTLFFKFVQGLNPNMMLTFDTWPWNWLFCFKIPSSKVLQPFVQILQSLIPVLWLHPHYRPHCILCLWIKSPRSLKFCRIWQKFRDCSLHLNLNACQIWMEINDTEENYHLRRHQTIIPRNKILTLWYLYAINSCWTCTKNLCLHFYQQPVTILCEVLQRITIPS